MEDREMIYILDGLDCANCAAKIEEKVAKMPNVRTAGISLMDKKLRIRVEEPADEKDLESKIRSIVTAIEPDVSVRRLEASGSSKEGDSTSCRLDGASCSNGACDSCAAVESIGQDGEDEKKGKEIRNLKIRIAVGTGIFAAGLICSRVTGVPAPVAMILYVVSYLVLGYSVLLRAGRNLIRGHVFDENFLMSIATIGAFAIREWPEAVGVMLFYQVGEAFQLSALNASRRSVTELLRLRPDYANIEKDGEVIRVDPETVSVGDIILVKAGEKIPLDGVIVRGHAMLDTSALTGESLLREVGPEDTVASGCLSADGVLTIRVTALFSESTMSKMIELVTNASAKKTKSENRITRFARIYTPVVVIGAVLLAVIPVLFFHGEWQDWLYRALSFLVISCPCALVISIPLGYFGGIGAAGKRGILIKGSMYIDALAATDEIVFDKTGTLTAGSFAVQSVVPAETGKETELLRKAAGAEFYSDHPIAVSVLSAAKERGVEPMVYPPHAYREIPGRGVAVETESARLLLGNRSLMIDERIAGVPEPEEAGTILFAAENGVFIGYLAIADRIKDDAVSAIGELRRLGIKKISILTGDRRKSADATASQLRVDGVYSDLLPKDKLDIMDTILKGREKGAGKLLFVGDGINDSPVLARADIGASIGGLASGAAIEAADIVLMNDGVSSVPEVIRIARKTRRIVTENIVLSLGVKAAVLILATLGIANLWLAIFADVGVAFLAILNAMRAGRRLTKN